MNAMRMKRGTLLIAIVFLLGGCASKYAPQTTQVSHYPQCYSPLAELRDTEKEMGTSVASGALIGALLGAAGGLLMSGGKAEGAAIGAGVGAGVGAVAGASSAKTQEKKRLAHYLNDLDGDIRGLDNVSAASRLAIQCYDREFKVALKSFKAGRMTRQELDARYAEIKSGTAEATQFMGNAINQASQKETQYQAALNDAAREANRPVPVIAPSTPDKQKNAKKTTRSKPKKQARPSVVATKSDSSDELTQMAKQTTALAQSREELQNEVSEANNLQQSWAADLAAIRS
ncbi:MAG: hypothetical protein RRY20_00055 [Bilophila sp.]